MSGSDPADEASSGGSIRREKTRVIDLRPKGATLDFLGFPFRYEPDHDGHGQQYRKVTPSQRALKRERAKLHELTGGRARYLPLPVLIQTLPRHLRGWGSYFHDGYPRRALAQINEQVPVCLRRNLRRDSPRPFRPPEGVTDYANFQRLGRKLLGS